MLLYIIACYTSISVVHSCCMHAIMVCLLHITTYLHAVLVYLLYIIFYLHAHQYNMQVTIMYSRYTSKACRYQNGIDVCLQSYPDSQIPQLPHNWDILAFIMEHLECPEPTHINSSPSGQNGRLFTDYVFRCIFMIEKFCVWIKISLKFVPKGPIDNNTALVQIMAWCQIGDKP